MDRGLDVEAFWHAKQPCHLVSVSNRSCPEERVLSRQAGRQRAAFDQTQALSSVRFVDIRHQLLEISDHANRQSMDLAERRALRQPDRMPIRALDLRGIQEHAAVAIQSRP